MPSDIEMSDSDSSILDTEITIDLEIIANIKPAPERVVHKCKEYIRHPGVRAAEAPSVIWRVGQEYERNRKKFWRCGLCKKTKLLAIHNYRIW